MNAKTQSVVPRHLIGQAVMQLDRVPARWNLDGNQEYAPPGTMAWVAETIAFLQRLVSASEPADAAGRPV